jgi:hypothetical protein
MRWRFGLVAGVAVLGLLTLAWPASTVQAQDYYSGYGLGTMNSNYAFGPPYGYGPYGAQTLTPEQYGYWLPATGTSGYVWQPNAYPYYGNYYYGAYPAYGYVYGGPLLYGRYGRGGRVGYRFSWY